jgi:electron transfer flavoprotein beta subunit
MAMGADRGIHVLTDIELQPLAVSKLLKAIISEEKPNLVIMGKQSIDDDFNQTGQMLAALLGWPQATFASKITLTNDSAEISREVDSGTEVINVKLPAIITTDLRLNEPRYAALPNIMKARSKPLATKKPEDYGVDINPRLKTIKVEEPAKRKGGTKVADVTELVGKLKEAGVL